MNLLPENEIFGRVGEEGFKRLVAAFYRRVPSDDILGRMYPAHDMAAAEVRLRDFLIFRFGGPPRYIERRGHPRLRMRHAPFQVDIAARERWVKLMVEALAETGLDPEAGRSLQQFFNHVATFLINSD